MTKLRGTGREACDRKRKPPCHIKGEPKGGKRSTMKRDAVVPVFREGKPSRSYSNRKSLNSKGRTEAGRRKPAIRKRRREIAVEGRKGGGWTRPDQRELVR